MAENISEKDLKQFKLMLLVLPIVPDIIFYFKGHIKIAVILTAILWGMLFILLVTNMLGFNIDKPVYKAVKFLLKTAGVILSSIALVITWIFTVLPMGILAKIVKRDRLRLNKPKGDSYWVDYVEKEPTYENQY